MFRLAYSRYKHVRANTIGDVNVHISNTHSGSKGKLDSSNWPKFTALRLFVETLPIYDAVATGNRNNELYRETARSNWKYPIATMPDYSRITVFILTSLIFRYHLPLKMTLFAIFFKRTKKALIVQYLGGLLTLIILLNVLIS